MHLIRVSIELQMQQLIFVFYLSKKYFLINFGTVVISALILINNRPSLIRSSA
jgi:hypothetical protein